jgi:hypothetical protein
VLRFTRPAPPPQALSVATLFFDFDINKGLSLEYQGRIQSLVFTPEQSTQRFVLG